MMDAIERAVMVPATEIAVHRAARRQVLRHRRPLAPCAEYMHASIDDLAHHDRPLVAASPGGWDQRRNDRPFLIGQIAGIAQFAAVITTAVLTRPHPAPPAKPCLSQGFTSDSRDSRCFEIDTKYGPLIGAPCLLALRPMW